MLLFSAFFQANEMNLQLFISRVP